MSMVTKYLSHICINFSWGHYEFKAIKKKLQVSLSIWDLASYFHISLWKGKVRKDYSWQKCLGSVKDCDLWHTSSYSSHNSCFSVSFLYASTSQAVVSSLGLRNIFYAFCVSCAVEDRRRCSLMDIWSNPIA